MIKKNHLLVFFMFFICFACRNAEKSKINAYKSIETEFGCAEITEMVQNGNVIILKAVNCNTIDTKNDSLMRLSARNLAVNAYKISRFGSQYKGVKVSLQNGASSEGSNIGFVMDSLKNWSEAK